MSCSAAALAALEDQVLRCLAGGESGSLEVLGYGEVTTVLGVDEGDERYAVKRLPPFLDRAEAGRHAAAIERYVGGLSDRGVAVLPTEVRLVDGPAGDCVLYLVQPRLEPDTLGPGVFRGADEAGARLAFGRIFEVLQQAVDGTLAPDGQLANWAFVNGALLYLDLSTPFIRKPDGSLDTDWSFFVRSMPLPMRPVMRREIPKVVARYCGLRHQVLDFLANLRKERLEHLIDPLLADANRRLTGKPIGRAAIERYYVQDARGYSTMQAIRRGHRWWTQRVLRRTYPVLLPPPIDRGL